MVPELPRVPLIGLIPAPAEVVRISFDVSKMVIEAERRFAEGFVEGLAPVTGKLMPWTRDGKPKRSEGSSTRNKSAEAA